eukprot:4878573-Amphidinium_carterae.1
MVLKVDGSWSMPLFGTDVEIELKRHMPAEALEAVQCRENSATFYAHWSYVPKLLRQPGRCGAYYKVHRDDP